MAYRVNPDGSIDCATAEEALNLQALILTRNARHAVNENHNDSPRPPDQQQQAGLPDLARQFLRALLERSQTAAEIAQRLDTKTTAFPPMYRGLRKWAMSVGLDYDTLIQRTAGSNGNVLSLNERARNIVEHAVKN